MYSIYATSNPKNRTSLMPRDSSRGRAWRVVTSRAPLPPPNEQHDTCHVKQKCPGVTQGTQPGRMLWLARADCGPLEPRFHLCFLTRVTRRLSEFRPTLRRSFVVRRGSAVGISMRISLPFRRQQWRSRVAHGTAPRADHLTPTERISSRASLRRNHVTRRYSTGGTGEGKERRQSPQGDKPEELKSSSTFGVCCQHHDAGGRFAPVGLIALLPAATATAPPLPASPSPFLTALAAAPPPLPASLSPILTAFPIHPHPLPSLWPYPSPATPLPVSPFLPYIAIFFFPLSPLQPLPPPPFLPPVPPALPYPFIAVPPRSPGHHHFLALHPYLPCSLPPSLNLSLSYFLLFLYLATIVVPSDTATEAAPVTV